MSTLPSLTFAALLKRYRLAAGLTQEELAERAHLSAKAIGALEQGTRRAPRKDTLDLLAEALRLDPQERALFQQAARGSTASPPPPLGPRLTTLPGSFPPLPLIGRTRELERLERHLAGEGPPVLWLAGEPGIGKTWLVQAAARRASDQGWTLLTGGCHRKSGQEPYAPLLGALAGALRHQAPAQQRLALQGCAWLVRLLPELAETRLVPAPTWTLPPEQERRLMFAAVGRYLANVAGPAGTLLVLDDLQWAGADALDLVRTLVHEAGNTPLRLIGAYRSTEVRPAEPLGTLVADLATAGLGSECRLGPLTPAEATSLLDALLHGVEDASAGVRAQVLARTGGVPYFLVSCAQALRLFALEGGPTEALPWNVAQSIRQRVAALPAVAQELLGVAAVMGREVPGTLLLALVSQPKAEVMAALEALDQAGLLVEGEATRYQFPHDLIREVVLSDLSAMRQRHWHGQIAAALEQAPGEPPIEQLAYHYTRADEQEKALLYLERAGDRAKTLQAHAEAESSYRDALALLERLGRPLEGARVCRKLSRILSAQARYDEALALLEQAMERYRRANDPAGQWRTLAQIGLEHFYQGTIQAGLERLAPWLASVRQAGLPEVQAIFQSCLGALYLYTRQFREALALLEEALAIARALRHERLVRQATLVRAQALMALGRLEEATQALEPIIPEQEVFSDEGSLAALSFLAITYSLRGDFPRSTAALERGLKAAERMGYVLWSAMLQAQRGSRAFFMGDWRQARQDYEQALGKSPPSSRSWERFVARFGLGRLDQAEGQWESATRQLQELMALTIEQTHLAMMHNPTPESVLAEDDLLHGQPATARARLEAAIRRFGDQQNIWDAEYLPLLGWTLLEVGEEEQAEALIAEGIARAKVYQHRQALVDALRIQALLCLRQQRWAAAEAALEEALALCRAMPYPYAEAKALYTSGLLHQAQGDTAQAREQLGAALAMLNRLGERLYAEQIERRLSGLKR